MPVKRRAQFLAVCGVVSAFASFSRVAHADDAVPESAPSAPTAVSSPPEPTADSPSEEPPPKPKKFKPRVMASIDGGLAYRALYGSHFGGGEITAAAGVDLKPGAVSLTTDLLYGKTEYGLTTWDWHMATIWEFRFNRLRVGLGPTLTYLQIGRVTTPDHPFWVVGAGLVGQVSFDLVQYDVVRNDGRPTTPHAFYAAIRFNFDDYLEVDDSGAVTYGPTFSLGYRY
jgi:hypothetical protein